MIGNLLRRGQGLIDSFCCPGSAESSAWAKDERSEAGSVDSCNRVAGSPNPGGRVQFEGGWRISREMAGGLGLVGTNQGARSLINLLESFGLGANPGTRSMTPRRQEGSLRPKSATGIDG